MERKRGSAGLAQPPPMMPMPQASSSSSGASARSRSSNGNNSNSNDNARYEQEIAQLRKELDGSKRKEDAALTLICSLRFVNVHCMLLCIRWLMIVALRRDEVQSLKRELARYQNPNDALLSNTTNSYNSNNARSTTKLKRALSVDRVESTTGNNSTSSSSSSSPRTNSPSPLTVAMIRPAPKRIDYANMRNLIKSSRADSPQLTEELLSDNDDGNMSVGSETNNNGGNTRRLSLSFSVAEVHRRSTTPPTSLSSIPSKPSSSSLDSKTLSAGITSVATESSSSGSSLQQRPTPDSLASSISMNNSAIGDMSPSLEPDQDIMGDSNMNLSQNSDTSANNSEVLTSRHPSPSPSASTPPVSEYPVSDGDFYMGGDDASRSLFRDLNEHTTTHSTTPLTVRTPSVASYMTELEYSSFSHTVATNVATASGAMFQTFGAGSSKVPGIPNDLRLFDRVVNEASRITSTKPSSQSDQSNDIKLQAAAPPSSSSKAEYAAVVESDVNNNDHDGCGGWFATLPAQTAKTLRDCIVKQETTQSPIECGISLAKRVNKAFEKTEIEKSSKKNAKTNEKDKSKAGPSKLLGFSLTKQIISALESVTANLSSSSPGVLVRIATACVVRLAFVCQVYAIDASTSRKADSKSFDSAVHKAVTALSMCHASDQSQQQDVDATVTSSLLQYAPSKVFDQLRSSFDSVKQSFILKALTDNFELPDDESDKSLSPITVPSSGDTTSMASVLGTASAATADENVSGDSANVPSATIPQQQASASTSLVSLSRKHSISSYRSGLGAQGKSKIAPAAQLSASAGNSTSTSVNTSTGTASSRLSGKTLYGIVQSGSVSNNSCSGDSDISSLVKPASTQLSCDTSSAAAVRSSHKRKSSSHGVASVDAVVTPSKKSARTKTALAAIHSTPVQGQANAGMIGGSFPFSASSNFIEDTPVAGHGQLQGSTNFKTNDGSRSFEPAKRVLF
jgi:hypothetical protein